MQRATSLIYTSEIIKFCFYHYVLINDVHLCDDTHHLYAIFKTGLRVTNVILTGNLGAREHHVGDPCSSINVGDPSSSIMAKMNKNSI